MKIFKLPIVNTKIQWNPSKMDTIGELTSVCYRGVLYSGSFIINNTANAIGILIE